MANKSTQSSTKRKAVKPPKPRPNFPLYPHLSGKWAKTIRGKTYYFGSWDDPHGAESQYLEVAEDLHAGRAPRQGTAGGPTIRDACNLFIKSKKAKLDAGNLSPRTFVDYDKTCRWLIEELGAHRLVTDIRPTDFENLHSKLSARHSITIIGGKVTMARSVFKYAYDMDLIEKPVKFGPSFKAPTATERRKYKAKQQHKHGSRVFEPHEIQLMLDHASPQLKAMFLLGINGGLGNTDCASLPLSALALDKGWLDYPRPKTGANRRIPLWEETVEALRKVIAKRKEPRNPEDQSLVFVTKYGLRWTRYVVKESEKLGKKMFRGQSDDAISKETAKLLKELGLKRPGLSFYSLRHTFETIAGGSRDQVAVDSIMGHIDSSMAANYRHGIEDERLRAVVDHVHSWLFGEGAEQSKEQPHQLRIVG